MFNIKNMQNNALANSFALFSDVYLQGEGDELGKVNN